VRSVIAGAALSLVLAGIVVAGDRQPERAWTLAGPAGESGTVKIDVSVRKRHDGRWRFYKVRFKDLPMQCVGGPTTFDFNGGATGVTMNAPDRDSFGLGLVEKNEHGERTYSWFYGGELTSHNTAEGFVRARGSEMPVEGGGEDDCHTGRLEWTASVVKR
jgi:hypothetical protein